MIKRDQQVAYIDYTVSHSPSCGGHEKVLFRKVLVMGDDFEDIVEWDLSPYDDQNFDSVSMGQSTVSDSDYAAQRIWAHELQRELASYGLALPPTGQFNVQIHLMANSNIQKSDTQQTQEVVTTPMKKKIQKFSWKVKLYGTFAILILTAAMTAVFLMTNANWKNETMTPVTVSEAITLSPKMTTSSFLETTTPFALKAISSSDVKTTSTLNGKRENKRLWERHQGQLLSLH